jgi:AraC family transcriptional regulator, regulatory protein of adaptative response / methylated-DNA-[protein]-cysteine methyltransferase
MSSTVPSLAGPPGRLPDEARWEAVLSRNTAFDGHFYYAVETTGIYCRPSCPAKRPKRAHVLFYDTIEDAEAGGFRACKRCNPGRPSLAAVQSAKISQACRMMETAETPPSLTTLAAAVGLSPHHFHRVFKAALGVTPKAYADAQRVSRVREGLRTAASVTKALYDAGFNSSGRFYATSPDTLGMSPRTYRAGGVGTEIRYATGTCSLGAILVGASDRGICAIFLGDSPDDLRTELRRQFPRADLREGDSAFARLAVQAIAYVEDPAGSFDLPLDIKGTAFQLRVWEALKHIQPGTTASYAEIAEAIGAPDAVRAVAGACAANKIAVAIPCHRVVRSDGGLSGYRWGVERKRALLGKEKTGR